MANSAHWQASQNEHRAAWIIACCCIATIFATSTWPGLFSFEPSSPVSESRQVKNQPPAKQQASSSTPKHEASRSIKKETQQLPNSKKAKNAIREIKPVISQEPQQQASKTIAAASGNYYVQAGAFKEKTLARKLASKLKEHGWNAVVVPKPGFHAVWVGPKNSRKSIENLKNSIDRTLKIKGFIVQKEIS